MHQGIVVNEFGDVMGMVTINDLFNALVGDVPLPDEDEPNIVQREDGSYFIDAQLPFAEFLERFAIPTAEQEGLAGFHILGSFVLHILSAIPKAANNSPGWTISLKSSISTRAVSTKFCSGKKPMTAPQWLMQNPPRLLLEWFRKESA